MAKVARSVGRLDFWNVYAEMTPYEIAITQGLWNLEPWGDDRADLRDAVNTAVQSGVNDDEAFNSLNNYLPVKLEDTVVEVTSEQASKRFFR